MERNLALELVRVTEAAALASARWMGKGDGAAADKAAREAMVQAMKSVRISGTISIGELDSRSRLSSGKKVGAGGQPEVAVALDPLESIESVAYGRTNAISVIAVSDKGSFFESPIKYMNKIAVGPEAAGCINIKADPLENLVNIADAKRCYVEDLTVSILDRDRHRDLIAKIRESGARIQLIPDGDVAAAIAATIPGSGVDVLMGIGGAREGVLSAAALKCVGGDFQGQVYVTDDDDAAALKKAEYGRRDRVLRMNDLVTGENTMFAATGVTKSDVVMGVAFARGGAATHSIVMRSRSGTVRFIQANHHFDKKPSY